MKRVVPKKLMPSGSEPLGLKHYSQIEVENIKLEAIHSGNTPFYSYNGSRKIVWRVPCFSNGFLNTANSFFSYKFQLTELSGVTDDTKLKLCDQPGAFIQKLEIRSSSGLTLESIDDFNVLKRILSLTGPDSDVKVSEGNAILKDEEERFYIAEDQEAGVYYTMSMNTGILSKHLSSWLPLFIMDNGPYAFEIEMTLAEARDCLQGIFLSKLEGTPPVVQAQYIISDPVYNMCIVKVDESTCKMYNEIACSQDKRFVIPFTTYRSHTTRLSSKKNTVSISEGCNDIRRIYTVFYDRQNIQDSTEKAYAFKGSLSNSLDQYKLISWNYKVGTHWLYNENIQESDTNSISLALVEAAHYKASRPGSSPMVLTRSNNKGKYFFDPTGVDPKTNSNSLGSWFLVDTHKPIYQSGDAFLVCGSMTYSEEGDMGIIQGVSTSLPILGHFEFQASTSLVANSFLELGFQLVIENGRLSYVENKEGDRDF